MKHYTLTDYQKTLRELKTIRLAGFSRYAFWRFICVTVYRFMRTDHDTKENAVHRIGRAVYAVGAALRILVLERCDFVGLENVREKTLLFTSDFYYANNRKDMLQTMRAVASVSDEASPVRTHKTKRFAPNPVYPVLAAIWYIRIRNVIPPGCIACAMRTIACAYLFQKCIRKHAAAIRSANALLTLNDENYDENLLVQFCQSCGIPTATLQHGHFWNTKDSEELVYYAHNFRELTADYFFAWGQYTCDLAVRDGVAPERMIPVGIPKYIDGTETLPICRNKVFGVFFDCPTTDVNNNFELMKYANFLAETYGYSFSVKLHPIDSAERYSGLPNARFLGFAKPLSVPEFSRTIDFSLVCTSTVFFEQIYFNKPVFRYVPPTAFDVFEGLDFSAFSDEAQLRERMDLYLRDEQEYRNRLREMTDYCCGEGSIAENYRKAIHRLNGLKKERRQVQ